MGRSWNLATLIVISPWAPIYLSVSPHTTLFLTLLPQEILTIIPNPKHITRTILIRIPLAMTLPPQISLRIRATLVDDAALHVVVIKGTRAVLGGAAVPSACRGLDADPLCFELPGCFASGAAAIEGGEGEERSERDEGEDEGEEHFENRGCGYEKSGRERVTVGFRGRWREINSMYHFFDCGRSIELSTRQEMHGKTEPCPAELNDGGEWRLVHWGRELRLAVSAPEWYYHAAIFVAHLHEATS